MFYYSQFAWSYGQPFSRGEFSILKVTWKILIVQSRYIWVAMRTIFCIGLLAMDYY